ncbi:MAG TPA: hypothetical protein VKB80_24405 [Kofleriaceae bacterium]|nr:hypothetical protein [Kofleriaceae bacterium]
MRLAVSVAVRDSFGSSVARDSACGSGGGSCGDESSLGSRVGSPVERDSGFGSGGGRDSSVGSGSGLGST